MRKAKGRLARELRSRAHALRPSVQVGKAGVTDAVVAATDEALATKDLVKVKLLESSRTDALVAGHEISSRTEAWVAGVVGRVIILFRPLPNESGERILPEGLLDDGMVPEPRASLQAADEDWE